MCFIATFRRLCLRACPDDGGRRLVSRTRVQRVIKISYSHRTGWIGTATFRCDNNIMYTTCTTVLTRLHKIHIWDSRSKRFIAATVYHIVPLTVAAVLTSFTRTSHRSRARGRYTQIVHCTSILYVREISKIGRDTRRTPNKSRLVSIRCLTFVHNNNNLNIDVSACACSYTK